MKNIKHNKELLWFKMKYRRNPMRAKVQGPQIPWTRLVLAGGTIGLITAALFCKLSDRLSSISPQEVDEKIRAARADAQIVSNYIRDEHYHR